MLESYFLWIYVALIVHNGVFKLILKGLSAKLDAIRAHHHRWNYVVSMEYMMEMIVSFVYYSYFISILILLNKSEQRDVSKVIGVIFLHFIFECFETSIKLSSAYFDAANSLLHAMNIRDHNCCCRGLHRLFRDNANMKEWKYMVSMDIVLRIHISILVYSTKLLLLSGFARSLNVNNNIYAYIGSVLTLQMVYYCIVHFSERIRTKFNIFALFVNYCLDISLLQQILFIALFVGAVIIF